MKLLAKLNQLSRQRTAWALLLVCALGLEATALYFQHVMSLAPCVMCIYERIAMLGIAFSGLLGLVGCKMLLLRLAAIGLWLYSSIQGLLLGMEHVGYQIDPSPFATCTVLLNFPSWLPLDQWLPAFFKASGDCTDIVWQWLDLSMPQWLLAIFVANAVIATLILISQVVRLRR